MRASRRGPVEVLTVGSFGAQEGKGGSFRYLGELAATATRFFEDTMTGRRKDHVERVAAGNSSDGTL